LIYCSEEVILDEEGSVEDMDMPSGEEVTQKAVDMSALVVYATLASILTCCCRSWTHTSTRRLLQASRKQTLTQPVMMLVRQACLQKPVERCLQDSLAGH
jgi:hypothetical protein